MQGYSKVYCKSVFEIVEVKLGNAKDTTAAIDRSQQQFTRYFSIHHLLKIGSAQLVRNMYSPTSDEVLSTYSSGYAILTILSSFIDATHAPEKAVSSVRTNFNCNMRS